VVIESVHTNKNSDITQQQSTPAPRRKGATQHYANQTRNLVHEKRRPERRYESPIRPHSRLQNASPTQQQQQQQQQLLLLHHQHLHGILRRGLLGF
jgi:hypothetical protein